MRFLFCFLGFWGLCSPFLRAQSAIPATTESTYIDARIDGMVAGKTRLVGVFGDQNYLADSAVIDATGHFTLRRAKPLPPGFYSFLVPGNKSFAILIDLDQRFSLRANIADLLGTMQVDGSANTDLLYQSFRFQAKQEAEAAALTETLRKFAPNTPEHQQAKAGQNKIVDDRKRYLEGLYKAHPNAFFTKFKIAGQNPDLVDFRKPNGVLDTLRQVLDYRRRFWDNVDFADKRLLHTPVISNKLKRYVKDLTPQQPDSIIKVVDPLIRRVMPYRDYFQFFTNWTALQYENGKTTVMDGEAVFVHIIQQFITPELAFWDKKENIEKIQKLAWELQASLVGRKGPDVRANDPNGVPRSIYEKTAPLIVVFMFSPDCEHCQKDASKIQQIYEKWKNRGVDFYGIGVNTKEDEWKAFLQKTGFTFTNVFDPTNRAIYAKYYVDNTPELYILNRDRIIVAKNLNADQLEQVFERELAKIK